MKAMALHVSLRSTYGALGLLGAAMLGRTVFLVVQDAPITVISGEGAMVLGLGFMAFAAAKLLPSFDRLSQILLILTLILFGFSVLAPMWRLAYPKPALYQGVLGGHVRHIQTEPAPRAGRYVVSLTPESGVSGAGAYSLLLNAGGKKTTMDGHGGGAGQLKEVFLEVDQTLSVTVMQSLGSHSILVKSPSFPWLWAQIGALMAVLFAMAAEIFARPTRRQGLFTMVVTGLAWSTSMLGTVDLVRASDVIVAVILGVLIGVVCGGMTLGLSGIRQRRGRALG